MQIDKKELDNLNAQLTIKIDEKDYGEKVEKKLKEFKKNLEMPGFRKGKVPMNLIKQKYELPLVIDEVNKQIQDGLNDYITKNNIKILGYPIPSENKTEIDWASKNYKFDFDLGLAPEFEVDLEKLEGITAYKITADKKLIDKEVAQIQQQYGTFSDLEKVQKDSYVIGTFSNEAEGINSQTTVNTADLTAKAQKLLIGKKKGDTVEFNSKELYKDPHTMMHALNISHDKVHDLNVPLQFEISGVFELKPAEINQELLEKVFGDKKLKDEAGLRKFIKEDIEKQLEQSADNQLLNDVTDKLLETVKFDLPKDFLIRWIALDSDEELTPEQAKEKYEVSEKGLKFQLIEEKIIKKYDIKVTYDDLMNLTKDLLKLQMLQYGQAVPADEELEKIAINILNNKEEANRLTEQIIRKKLVNLYKEKIPVTNKKISYNKFLDLNK
jgi:trigger factor